MAHKEQRQFCNFVKSRYPEFFNNKKVLDIGSLDINGNNRTLFNNCNYTGIDVGSGNNVDIISVGHLFDGKDDDYDVIISTEVFEHDMYYEQTITNIMRMLKPGGLFLFTCAAPGRPEHGTKKNGEFCAPLLTQISEEWGNYYKNLTEVDIRKIPKFEETFENVHFEFKDTNIEIPSDLYFYGFKKNIIKPKFNDFNDDVFIIDCWLDTTEKEKKLKNLLSVLRVYGSPIILSTHLPVNCEIQKLVDYYIYDNNNDVLLQKDFEEFGINSDRWTETEDYRLTNKMEFHHDYAIWLTMKNAFSLAKEIGKKYIHFLEFDNLPDEVQYRQAFMEYVKKHDAVIYEYDKGSTKTLSPYCATYIFSIRTEVGLKVLNQINSKKEFFMNRPNGWQLEKVFYQSLLKVTNNIYLSEYIPNNNELNTNAVWNRNGILRNGAKFQAYLGVDESDNLYLNLISGFEGDPTDMNYLIEINYYKTQLFHYLNAGEMSLINLGKYRQNENIILFYEGIEVFNEHTKDTIHQFRRKNELNFKKKNIDRNININFIDGPFVEIIENSTNTYSVEFINSRNNKTLFSLDLKSNHWAKCSYTYYIDWIIKIKSKTDDFYYEHKFSLDDKKVVVSFESSSLGDTLGWISYVEKFRVEKNCKVICSTFHNELFRDYYPHIEFVVPGTSVEGLHALYRLGVFYKDNQIDMFKHPLDPRTEPLLKIASDILGLTYVELKPKIQHHNVEKKRLVCIGIHGTAQCKYWNNPNGWQDVVNFLIGKGYEVRLLSSEDDGYMGNYEPKGITKQPKGNVTNFLKTLQESELFIGISSGLSWVAWASSVKTVLISGFTDVYTEPFDGITRIINKDVCNSCWNNHHFDKSDWNWCPEHKGTKREFECSKMITSKQVIDEVSKLLV